MWGGRDVVKHHPGSRLDCRVTAREGTQNLLCAYLAAAVLTGGEHRRYGLADVGRLLFIRGAQRLGMQAAMPGPGCPDLLPGTWYPPGLPLPEGR